MPSDLCNHPNPGPDAGTCAFPAAHSGRHSFEPSSRPGNDDASPSPRGDTDASPRSKPTRRR